MVSANELRKGNYVQDIVSGEWMIVDELGENVGAVLINRDKYPLPDGWQMGPTPLTPAVLMRCGLKDPAGNGMAYRMDHGNSMEFCCYVKDGFMRYQTKLSGMSFNFGGRITSLHLFQNMYCLLTGEELEIKSLHDQPANNTKV
jgi:hypothetical protein